MRILFISATRIGDAVLSTGIADYLLRQHPHARFTVACGTPAAGVFLRMPNRDRTITIDKRRFDRHWLSLWRQTVMTFWDFAVDLRGSALTLLLPVRRRAIMRGGRRPGHRLTHLAGVLNLREAPLPVSWFTDEDRACARSLLPGGVPLVGLGPTANWLGKIWPPERFVALFQRLQANLPGLRPVIFAGPGAAEQAMAEPVVAALPDAINLAGRVTLPQAAACLSLCRLFVGNDSGLMHLSAASSAPTIGLFGPTRAAEYAPVGRHAAAVIAPGPAGNSMAAISVEQVMATAQALL